MPYHIKKSSLSSFAVLLLSLAFSGGYAQSCWGLPLFREGKQFVFLVEKAGAITSKRTYTISTVRRTADSLYATLSITTSDEGILPNDPSQVGTFDGILCNGRSLFYRTSVNSPAINGVYALEYPLGMKVGDRFKDQIVPFSSNSTQQTLPSGINLVIRRNVEGQETISTPAGSWACFKVVETVTTHIPGKNGSPDTAVDSPPINTWFSPLMGIIKITVGQTLSITLIALS